MRAVFGATASLVMLQSIGAFAPAISM